MDMNYFLKRLQAGEDMSDIGNEIADLMNEAQAASARAQQALFAANVTYKVKSGLYSRIASALQIESVAGRTGR